MSFEERLLMLAEAQRSLAETQENSDRKIAALADAQIRTEDHVRQLEQAFVILTELAKNTDTRLDHLGADQQSFTDKLQSIMEMHENSERKIAALVDAQIRTEDTIARIEKTSAGNQDAWAKTEESLRRLTELHTRTESKLEALIDVVRQKPPR